MQPTILSHMTPRLLQIMVVAQKRAHEKREASIAPNHILFAFLIKQRPLLTQLLGTKEIEIKYLKVPIVRHEKKPANSQGASNLLLSSETERFLKLAHAEAESLGKSYVGVEHVVLAWLKIQESGEVLLPVLLPSTYRKVRLAVENMQ